MSTEVPKGWAIPPFPPTDKIFNLATGKQVDPITGQSTGGVKFDGGKVPVMSGAIEYFGLGLLAVAVISQFGYNKYGEWQGWRKVPEAARRYADAQGRHIVQKEQPDTTADTAKMQEMMKALGIANPSTKLVHMAQGAWNSLAVLELQVEKERDGK